MHKMEATVEVPDLLDKIKWFSTDFLKKKMGFQIIELTNYISGS